MTNSQSSDFAGDLHNYSIDFKNRELYLHGYIANCEEDPGVDYRMSSSFIKNIRFLDAISTDPIIIHMNSVGGNWGDGMSIYDAIRVCRSHITIIPYGQAASMSSVILQAADTRIMMPNSYFMSHFGNSSNCGNYLDTQRWSKFEEKILDTMLDIYTESCIKGKYFSESLKEVTEAKVKSFLKRKLKNGDWYLSSNEAVYYGFADAVLSTRKHKTINSLK